MGPKLARANVRWDERQLTSWYGTDLVGDISPRALLLQHGTADQILPDTCSRDLYRRANESKQLLLYPGCRHGLDEGQPEVDRDSLDWVRTVLHPHQLVR